MAKTKAQKQAYNQMLSDAYDQIAGALGKQSATPTQTTNQQSNTYTPTLSKDEVGKMYDDYMASLNSQNNTPSIPKLEDMGQNNTAPSTSVSLPNLDDLRSQLADTTTNRTEGETKALQDYIQGIETLQQNTYKQNYNDEINKVRNRLGTDMNLTEGERKANEEYLSGLNTLQAEIDRYNRPKYTPNNASNNTSTTNNVKQKKSKYEGKNIHIAESEKDKQLNENDIVEINGQYYTKQALADQRQANRERVRENKLMKSESDSVKGFIKKFESANAQLLNNQVKAAYQMGKDKINEKNNANKVLNLQNKTEPYTETEAKTLLSNLSPEDLNIVKGWATYPEYDVDELVKNTDWTIDKLNKYADAYNVANGDAQTYDANKFQKWSNSRYNLSVANGEIRNQYDKATQKAFEDGNNDALMQVFASLDDNSKEIIQDEYDGQKSSNSSVSEDRESYINELMNNNPGMTEQTARYFLDNAKSFVGDFDNVDNYFRNNVDKWLDPNYVISPQEEALFEKYRNEMLPEKYEDFEDYWEQRFSGATNLWRAFNKSFKEHSVPSEDAGYYSKLNQVSQKLDNNQAIMQGVQNAMPFGRQLEGLALDMMGYTDEQKQAWYNDARHQSATQNPYASMYGQLPVEVGKYIVGGEVFDSIPALAKLGDKASGLIKGESALANGARNHIGKLVNDTMLDVAVDTIPGVANDIYDGKSAGEVLTNALENVGVNIGWNLFTDLLSSKLLKSNKALANETIDDIGKATSDKVAFVNPKAEQVTENAMLDLGIVKDEADAILKADNVVANATDTTNNVVDTLAKQEDEIRNIGNQVQDTIDNIPKVEPTDIQLSPEDLASLKTDFNSFSKSLNGKFNWYKLNNNPDVINVKEAMANFKKNPSKESWDEFVESYNTFAKNIESKPVYRAYVTDRTKSKWGDWDAYGEVQKRIDGLGSKYGFNNNTNIPELDDIAKASSQTPINNSVDMPNANVVDNNVADNLLDAKYSSKDIDTSAIPIDKTKTRIDANSYNGMKNMTIAKTEIQDDIKDAFLDVPRYHEVLSNKDTFARAEYILNNSKDTNEALQDFNGLVAKQDPVAIPLGYEIADRLAKSGNSEMAVDIIDKMSEALTKSGQFSQAAAITMMKNDPVTALRFIERKINKMNKEGLERFGGRWKDFSLTDAEKDSILKLNRGDAEGIKQAYESIYDRIAKEYPSTMWEKVVEATKLAMMLNPRTHIRNVGANLMLVPIRSFSDRVSALGQNAYHLFNKDFEVTQSLIGGTKAQRNIAEEIFENRMKPLLDDSDKWADVTGALRNKQVFKDSKIGELAKDGTLKTLGLFDSMTGGRMTHFIEGLDESMKGSVIENLRNFDYYLLSTIEDDPFVKKNFVNRLASYMKAQGINDMASVPDMAIDIAWEESLKATFKDDNFMTKMFSGIKEKTGKFGEFMLPFTKTPANIAMRGIDYSPVGFVTSVRQYLKSTKSQADIVKLFDNLSKAFVGTSGIAVGYLLAKNGIITGTLPDDKDARKFAQQTGKLPFAINIGGRYYSYDWAQPAAIPMILGTALFESTNADEQEQNSFFGTFLNGAKDSINAWADLSPLQSLQNMFKENPATGKVDYGQNLIDTAIDFPQRLIPSLGGAIARTIDPVQRETFVNGDTTSTWFNTAQSKIPGLTDELPAQRDGWGRPIERQSNDGFFNSSFLANFLNPGQLSNDRSTEIDPEIQRLFDTTQSNKVFPTIAGYSVVDGDGNKITLDNYQHSEYQKEMGETSFALAKMFIESDTYQNLSDTERIDYLSKIYGLSERYAQNKLFGTKIKSDYTFMEMLQNGDYQGVADSLLQSAQRVATKNEMEMQGYPTNDFFYEAYQNNDTNVLDKAMEYQQEANKYTYTTSDRETKTLEITKSMYEDLEKMSSESEKKEYIAYQGKCKELKIDASERGFDAYKKGKIEEFANDYKATLKELGMSDSETAYKEWLKTGSIGLREYASKQKREKAKQESQRVTALENVYGGKQINNARDMYNNATKYIPKLTEAEWAVTYSQIDSLGKRNGEITQEEMFKYFKKNNKTEEEAQQYWKAYGDWKTIPYLKDGEWKTKKK